MLPAPDPTPRPTWTTRALPPFLMLLAVAALYLKPVLCELSFHNPAAFHNDILTGGLSTLHVLRQFFAEGIPPIWISNQVMGSPYLGPYISAIANPIVLLAIHFDFGASYNLLAAVNSLLIAGFGFLLFTRAGASGWGAAAAGFLAAMTGFVPWVMIVYPVGLPLAWLLAWMWSALGLAQKPLLRRWLWNLAANFFILMAGDAQITVQGAYILGAWFLLWAALSRLPLRALARVVFILLLAAAAAYLLATIQMLPTTLFFTRAITTRAPALGDYASTWPKALPALAGAVGLFTRLLKNLFLPVSVPLLLAAAIAGRRRNPAFLAALILALALWVLALGGRSGLAVIPFHLPLLKPFVRHYKLGLIMQGPLFIGVALGFDALLAFLRQRRRAWIAAALLALALTLAAIPEPGSRLALAAAAALLGLTLWKRNERDWTPALLFLLLTLDAGSYGWRTPYSFKLPDPDPVYTDYLRRLGFEGRSQGMYPWTVRAAEEINQPLPVHGTGYDGEYSIDCWIDFPLKNHAYFLAAICPDIISRIEHGQFSRVDFSTCFKSTDFVNAGNRHLVNLAALRYFFLQDMALKDADLFPILSDPEYLANPARPRAFEPFVRRRQRPTPDGPSELALVAGGFGAFRYRHPFRAGDRFTATLRRRAGPPGLAPAWFSLIATGGGAPRLLLARAAGPGAAGQTRGGWELGEDPEGQLAFSALPAFGFPADSALSAVAFIAPTIANPSRFLHYRAGNEVMVFENPEAFPRARIVHRARQVAGAEQAFALMRRPETYHPAVETLLESPDAEAADGPPPTPDEQARILRYQDHRVEIAARLSRPGWLVLSDTYYPGWRAFDEKGRELRVDLADLSLRAVRLPAGGHRVVFRYLPLDFEIGLWTTLASLLAAVLFILLRRAGAIASPPR